MAIPYLLIGSIDEEGTHLRKSDDHYDQLGIQLCRPARPQSTIEPKQVIARQGASARLRPPADRHRFAPDLPRFPASTSPNVHHVLDARGRAGDRAPGGEGRAGACRSGAGFIGCIIMEALAERGVKLTVVEMGDRMVPRMMTPTAAGMIRRGSRTTAYA